MAAAWVLVANHTEATLYQADIPVGSLNEIDRFQHAAGRTHGTQLYADDRGRYQQGPSTPRSAMERSTDAKTQQGQAFARELVERLERGRTENAFNRLYLVASPDFLGILREALTPPLQALVHATLSKNLVGQRASAVREHLPERL